MSLSITELFDHGTSFELDSRGPVCVRMFLVEGLDTSLNPAVRLRQAALADANGVRIPRYAEGLVGVNGVYASNIKPAFFPSGSSTSALVSVTYSAPEHQGGTLGSFTLSCDPATSETPVSRDLSGDPLFVTYTDPVTSEVGKNTVRLSVLRPRPIVTWQTITDVINPLDLTLRYSGKVNDNSWQGGDERTWLCRGVGFERLAGSIDGTGRWFRLTYVFQYDPLKWDQYYYFQDPVTKRIPNDIAVSDDNDNGIYTYKPEQEDFNALRVPTFGIAL